MKAARMVAALVVASSAVFSEAGLAQSISEPGGDGQSTQNAMFTPDEFAWQLFLYMSHPALAGKAGVADASKKLGENPESPVVWETWALESGSLKADLPSHSEVYKRDGSKPVDWGALDRTQRALILDQNLEQVAVLGASTRPTVRFDKQSPDGQEVRANRVTFEFIVKNKMYNLDGLSALYKKARNDETRTLIQFPQGAKEIKAQWYPIHEADKSRYFWRDATGPDGKQRPYGLVALHIITKDLPNWFWADFGHFDCESNEGACNESWLTSVLGKHPLQEPALTPLRDSTTVDSNGTRKETKGTVWENYRLRGTQINFVSAIGSQTILSNPVIETTFQQSSCMTCHARATIGPHSQDSSRSPDPLSPGDPELGAPNQTLFGAGPGLARSTQNSVQYMQTDFVWSSPFRAHKCSVPAGCD